MTTNGQLMVCTAKYDLLTFATYDLNSGCMKRHDFILSARAYEIKAQILMLTFSNGINDLSVLQSRELLSLDVGPCF